MSEQLINESITAALRSVVGAQNVFLDFVPQNSPRKCARYMIVSENTDTSICGSDPATYTYRLQVDIWDETQDLAVATRAAALAAITSMSVFGENAVTHIGRNSVPYDEQTRESRRSDDYYINLSTVSYS